MTLTKEQSDHLKDYFPVSSHEFLRGFTYITEESITDRLDEVDPAWTFERLSEFVYRDEQVIVTFRLTVSGTYRDGVGMDTIKKGVGEAEKSAATDALKRAARLFGIGRYILEMKNVNDHKSLADWLARQCGINQSTGEIGIVDTNTAKTAKAALKGNGPTERSITASKSTNPANANAGANAGTSEWIFDLNTVVFEVGKIFKSVSSAERYNTVKKMHEQEHAFDNAAGMDQCIQLIIPRLQSHQKKVAS